MAGDWQEQVKSEYEEVRNRFRHMSFKSFKRGDWLAAFVAHVLASYVKRADVEQIYQKYRGETSEEQARQVISQAAKQCGLSGRLTASFASAAELSFIPTFGFSFPGIGAAVGLSVMTDIGYCIRRHIRAMYDLSLVYGGPLTEDDVEDCYLIFMSAMEVNIDDVISGLRKLKVPLPQRNQHYMTYNARTILKSGIRSFFQDVTKHGGGNLLIRKLVERVNLRLLVPGVSVAIAGTFNQRFTRRVLRVAHHHMRWRGAVMQPLLLLQECEPRLDPLWALRAMVVVIESGAPAEWTRHQLDALRYCQSALFLSDEDMTELDPWFRCDKTAFVQSLPAISPEAAEYLIEMLVVVAAMSPDIRHDRSYAAIIVGIADALDFPVSLGSIAEDIQNMRSAHSDAIKPL